jgi:DNA-binding MurR/RpiR family transcriptional regulator
MMAGHGERRSRKQEQAIAALLAEPTIAAAAARVGVSEVTVARWLREPSFAAAYRKARRDVVEQAVGRLQQAAGEAVDALKGNLTAANPAAVNSAARAILEHAIKGVELVDLAERVEALEAAAKERDGR